MLNKTTITAIRTLVFVGLNPGAEPSSVRCIAERLGESPTYMAKVAGLLVKAGILQARRGVAGGIELNRPAEQINFLEIVEACQGTILPDYCRDTRSLSDTCAFHAATAELHQAITGVLSRWTLAQFVRCPVPSAGSVAMSACILAPCLASRKSNKHRPSSAHQGKKLRAGK